MKDNNETEKKTELDIFAAIMNHNFDAEIFKIHFDLAGIASAGFDLTEFCETHSRLMADPVISERSAKKLAAIPKREFSVAKFLELPWESGYFKNTLPPEGIFESVVGEMTLQEKLAVRERVLKIKN